MKPMRALPLLLSLMLLLPTGCALKQKWDKRKKQKAIAELFQQYQQSVPAVPVITVSEVLERRRAGSLVLVDARTKNEQRISMIPGALTADQFKRDKESHRDNTIVAYCTIGSRSGELAQELRSEGFDAYNLEGSILSWIHAGQPLHNRDGTAVQQVHVYGPLWDLAPASYDAVW